jgi:hypothetical protein
LMTLKAVNNDRNPAGNKGLLSAGQLGFRTVQFFYLSLVY